MTKEHIPPESAFNDSPLLLMKVDERSTNTGEMDWAPNQHFGRGMYVRSVCARCNNQCGSRYGGAYVDLVRRVAERIGDIQEFHTISILGVKRPLAILKQVLFQFVSTNGPGFVRANDWVAPFIRNPKNQSLHRMLESIFLPQIAQEHDAREFLRILTCRRVPNSMWWRNFRSGRLAL